MTDSPQPKRTVRVDDLGALRRIVDELIASGDTDVKLDLNPILLADEQTYDILEEIVAYHPRSKPDGRPSQTETQTETQAEAEVISYVEGSLEVQNYQGFDYQVFEAPDGFRVKVDLGCRGWIEPWDCAFSDIDDADEHGLAYIKSIIGDEK